MKVNGQQSVPAFVPTSNVKSTRTDANREVSDSVEMGANRSVSEQSPRIQGRWNNKDNDNKSVRRKEWQNYNNNASVNVAGQAGIAGSVGAMSLHYPDGRWNLKAIADKKMLEHGMVIDYTPAAKEQTSKIMSEVRPAPGVYNLPEDAKNPWVRDLRGEHFVSVDNGTLWTKMNPEELAKDPEANMTSKDLDQLQGKPEKLPNGDIKMKIAVSDIDAFIKKGDALDQQMDVNGQSVYTPDKIYNLIPRELAEDVISLNPREDRLATIIEFTVGPDGKVKDEDCYQAIVNSRAKLDYSSVGAWLEGKEQPSPAMESDPDTLESLKLQDEVSQRLKAARKERGALEFESNEVRILTENGSAVGFEKGEKNRATELVENCMVTSNEVISRFLRSKGFPTLERVVVPPEKWDRIQELAAGEGAKLPSKPDGKALADFLSAQKAKDPEGFNELSFSVIKLIGRGEYQAVGPKEELPGHFGLGAKNYSQCTASIRRGGDRIAGRMLKAALAGKPSPYTQSELNAFAGNVTEKEQINKKVERAVEKSVIASMLTDDIGKQFSGVISGVKGNKAWVRIGDPPVEGSISGVKNPKVGDKVKAELKSVNVEKGFIDFAWTK